MPLILSQMRLLITADLHYNHPRSRALADEVIDRMNAAGGDGVLVIGDTAIADGDALEQCLARFNIPGPRLLLAGNHELWTRRDDSRPIFFEELPRRAAALGWHWLEDEPFVADRFAIVGTVGWYDYRFAQPSLEIPERFYRAKVSPGAVRFVAGMTHLLQNPADVSGKAMEVVARWNDGKFIHLHESDEAFLEGRLTSLRRQLQQMRASPRVIAAVHHLPFAQLLPPPHSAQWDFAKAYLGSPRLGDLLLEYPNVTDCFCGHSHFPLCAQVHHIRAVNIGSGYRHKTFLPLDLPD